MIKFVLCLFLINEVTWAADKERYECKESLETVYNLSSEISPDYFGTYGLFNYQPGNVISSAFESGKMHAQNVRSFSELPPEIQRLGRRLKLLTVAPDLECGFREVGAFVFQFEDGRFQPVIHTLNRPTAALDQATFNRIFESFPLRGEVRQVQKIWYVHQHPNILDPCIQRLNNTPHSTPFEARAAGRPWESALVLSEDDFRSAHLFQEVFRKQMKFAADFEIIALSTIPRFETIYFSYALSNPGSRTVKVSRSRAVRPRKRLRQNPRPSSEM